MTAEQELYNCEDFDWKRSEKFVRVLNLKDRFCQMGGEKTGIWGGGNPSSRHDFSVRQFSDDLRNFRR